MQEEKEARCQRRVTRVLGQTCLGTQDSHCQWGIKVQEPSVVLQVKGELLIGDAKT